MEDNKCEHCNSNLIELVRFDSSSCGINGGYDEVVISQCFICKTVDIYIINGE